MPNLQLNYMYRDWANYKNPNEVVFANPNNRSPKEVTAIIKSKLLDEQWFYASQWKVPDMHFDKWDDEIDHTFHEFESVEYTNNPPTDARSIDEFLEQACFKVQ